jgi:hypothetical protein
MHKSVWAIAAASGLALGLLTAPAGAAPAIATSASGMKAAISETSNIDQVRWHRHCWRDRWGHFRCRRVWAAP